MDQRDVCTLTFVPTVFTGNADGNEFVSINTIIVKKMKHINMRKFTGHNKT